MKKTIRIISVLALCFALSFTLCASAFFAVGTVDKSNDETVVFDITYCNNSGSATITAKPVPTFFGEDGSILSVTVDESLSLAPGQSVTRTYSLDAETAASSVIGKVFLLSSGNVFLPYFSDDEYNPALRLVDINITGGIEESNDK